MVFCSEVKMNLYEKTLKLIRNCPRNITYADIGHNTGLSIHWIEKFGQGKIKNPSVQKVQTLYEFLTGKKLEI